MVWMNIVSNQKANYEVMADAASNRTLQWRSARACDSSSFMCVRLSLLFHEVQEPAASCYTPHGATDISATQAVDNILKSQNQACLLVGIKPTISWMRGSSCNGPSPHANATAYRLLSLGCDVIFLRVCRDRPSLDHRDIPNKLS